jgi:hypothetical protein
MLVAAVGVMALMVLVALAVQVAVEQVAVE